MLTLDLHITIGAVTARTAKAVQVRSAFRELTDTCTINMPRNVRLRDKPILDYLKPGDPVKVELGYTSSGMRTVFEGYLLRVNPQTPLVLECEDAMYLLKRKTVNKSWERVNLPELVEYVVGDTLPIARVDDFELGPVEINNVTAAQALEAMRSYGAFAYIRNNALQCGLATDTTIDPRRVQLNLMENVIPPVELTYRRREDVSFKVKATSFMADGEKIEVEVGDPEGETRSLFYNGLTEAETKAAAERDLKRIKVDGYAGSVTLFGEPAVAHGDIVEITDPEYPEREGSYSVDEVATSMSTDGFRQVVTIGAQV